MTKINKARCFKEDLHTKYPTKEEIMKSKAGQYANLAKLTDEDKRKIGQFYTSLIG